MRRLALMVVGAALLLGCPGKPEGQDGGTDGGGGGLDCSAFADRHQELLNAATTAVVVKKTPTHPPLDGGLP